MTEEVTKDLENYSLDIPFKKILEFVVNDFSRGYIKLTRDREDTKEILGEVLEKISLLLAPFAPYISENIYQNFSKKSVHLSSWPKVDKKKIDVKLEQEFESALKVIEVGLRARDKAGIGLKWPLANAKVNSKESLNNELKEIVKDQLNLKNIEIVVGEEFNVELDTNMTPDLEAEGYARNIARGIQALRKKTGLVKEDFIELVIVSDKESELIIKDWEKFLKERTNVKKFSISNSFKDANFVGEELKIKNKGFHIYLKKIK